MKFLNQMPTIMGNNEKIILFDGVCNLCNGMVIFTIKRDPHLKFKFASLQSEAGQALLKKFNLLTNDLESFVYICDGKYYRRSSAALHVFKELNGLWWCLYAFIVIPAFLRDLVYRMVARCRYKIFGKKNVCMIPSPSIKSRFLE